MSAYLREVKLRRHRTRDGRIVATFRFTGDNAHFTYKKKLTPDEWASFKQKQHALPLFKRTPAALGL